MTMKTSIITHDMVYIQGSNRVTEKLILGRDQFVSLGIQLEKVYTKDGVMFCNEYKPSDLGKVELTQSYKRKRIIIEKLKKIPFYNSYFGSKWSVKKNLKHDKKAAVNAIRLDNDKTDCYLIQGFYVAYYFLKYRNKNNKAKVIMVLHTDRDPLEQLLLKKQKLIGTKFERKLRGMFEFALKNSDNVVTICRSETEYLLENYDFKPSYITNGIEDINYAQSVTCKLSQDNKRINFVVVATVQYRKGQDILVDAINILPEAIRNKILLHIVGGGVDQQLISKKIFDYGLEDCCKMYGARQDISEILSQMDIFILTTRADTTPICIIEALRAGLPVISTAVGEIPIMIKNAGVLVEANVQSVAEVIANCVNGKYNLQGMALNSRKNYEKYYSLKTMINSYAELISGIFNK